mgnify:CR=1 FL=1
MIEKYKRIHRIGMHCEAVAVRDIIQYYGTDLTFHDLIGVSGTLASISCEPHSFNSDMPYLSLNGYTSNIFLDATNALDLDVLIQNYDTFEHSFKRICEFIDNKIPVIIRLAYNEYAPKIYEQKPFPDIIAACVDIDFGAHYIQLLAYDMDRQYVFFVESDKTDIQSMPIELLKKSMNKKTKEMPAENEFMVILPPTAPVTLGKVQIISSYQKMYLKTCNNFIYGNKAFVGVKGIKKFKNEFIEILNSCDEAYIRANVAWLLISTGGIFGSNILFKGSLKRYCDSAYKITNIKEFITLSQIAGKLEKGWRTFDNDLYKYLSDRDIDRLKQSIENMDGLILQEQEYSDKLGDIVCNMILGEMNIA